MRFRWNVPSGGLINDENNKRERKGRRKKGDEIKWRESSAIHDVWTTWSFLSDPVQPPPRRKKKSYKMRANEYERVRRARDGSGFLFILLMSIIFASLFGFGRAMDGRLFGERKKERERFKIVFTCWCAGMIYFFGILTLFSPVHLVTNFLGWIIGGFPSLSLSSVDFLHNLLFTPKSHTCTILGNKKKGAALDPHTRPSRSLLFHAVFWI